MAYSARIDELEKKFSENARRYFAPLANEYRKAGDLDRAIEICRAHLPQQPGHMSGHVVYGQALYESRQLEEAKTVFEAALALDPENLIALRHLGDIARDSSDPDSARMWYLRVLDADPRNDEVAGMLAELDAAAQAAQSTASGEPVAGASGWGDINPEQSPTAADTEETSPEHAASAAEAAPAEGPAEDPARGVEATDDAEASPAAPGPIDVAELGLEPMPSDSAAAAAAMVDRPRDKSGDRDEPQHRQGTERPEAPSLDRMLNDAFATDEGGGESARDPLASAAFARPESAEGVIAPAGPAAASGARAAESPPALDDNAFAEVDALFDEISPPGERAARKTGSGNAIPAPQTSSGIESESAVGSERADADRASATAGVTGDAMFGDVDLGPGASQSAAEGNTVPGLETREFVPPPRETGSSKTSRDTGSMAVSGLTSFEQPSGEDSSTRAAFVTETMAELYLQQGFTAEALDIYRQLLEQNPADTNLRDRIQQLELGGRTSLSVAAVSSQVIEAAQQRHAARPVRTVRSFFGRLAGHQVHPREQAGGEAEEWPESAAREPEESPASASSEKRGEGTDRAPRWMPEGEPAEGAPAAGGTEPSAPSVIGDLFAENAVDDADEAAASMLASAFSPSFRGNDEPAVQSGSASSPSGGGASASAGGKAAHTAGRELSLDQVFRDSENRAPRKSGGYSFDQFFSDGSQPETRSRQTPAEGTGSAGSDEPEGDLEQFTAWLEGLKRK